MKNHAIKFYAAALGALVFATSSLQAGPGPQQIYVPVKTAAEAEALKADTKIAITCPSCNAVTVSTVDKNKSHMHGFSCPVCKHTFELEPVGSGKASAGRLACKDTATGKKMSLQLCAQMHH
jgi:transposase-like protein